MRLKAVILMSCVLGLFSLTSRAQIKILSRETLEAVYSPRLSSDSLYLHFDTRHIRSGEMMENDPPAVFRYEMTNVGRETIDIRRLRTTCSCLTATASRNALEPGERTQLTVRYDPKGHFGKFEHKVFVYTGPGDSPAAVLKLSVDVQSARDMKDTYRIRMGCIGLRSDRIAFARGVKAVEILNFVNLSGKPLKLGCEDMFLPQCLKFETRPEVVEEGEEGVIVLTYEPDAGQVRDQVPLILKGLGVPPGTSTIKICFE